MNARADARYNPVSNVAKFTDLGKSMSGTNSRVDELDRRTQMSAIGNQARADTAEMRFMGDMDKYKYAPFVMPRSLPAQESRVGRDV